MKKFVEMLRAVAREFTAVQIQYLIELNQSNLYLEDALVATQKKLDEVTANNRSLAQENQTLNAQIESTTVEYLANTMKLMNQRDCWRSSTTIYRDEVSKLEIELEALHRTNQDLAEGVYDYSAKLKECQETVKSRENIHTYCKEVSELEEEIEILRCNSQDLADHVYDYSVKLKNWQKRIAKSQENIVPN